MTLDIDAMRRAAEAATPGDWYKSYTLNAYDIRIEGRPVVVVMH